MLVELLQPLGPEMVRRWVAVLLAVDRDERDSMVRMIEQFVAREYAARPAGLRPHAPGSRPAPPRPGA